MKVVDIPIMPTTRERVISCAREWVGTKFRHQASVKGQGADCAGLVRGVLVEAGAFPASYRAMLPRDFLAYAKSPDGSMKSICDGLFEQIETPQPGDIGLFKWFKFPQHLAFFGDYMHGGLSMIQALGPTYPNLVIENRFDQTWDRRMVAVYRIPGIT